MYNPLKFFIMKMFVALAVSVVGLVNSVSVFAADSNNLIGSWLLREENGQQQSNYYKNYFPDGRFTVEELCPIEEKVMGEGPGSSKVTYFESKVQQKGTWEKVGDNTIVEKCEMGDKGDVKISYTLADGFLNQSFAYNNAPEKIYSQKFCHVELPDGPIAMRERKIHQEFKVKHCGTFGTVEDIVFIIDGKHYDSVDDFNAAIPDDISQVENFSCNKSTHAFKYMTDEEIAAGKAGVLIVTLKK